MRPTDWTRQVSRLPEVFAGRLGDEEYHGLTKLRDAGQYGEMTDLLMDALVADQAPVNSTEQAELATLVATYPHIPIEKLNELRMS